MHVHVYVHNYVTNLSFSPQANTAEELGFHFAGMYYIDGEIVTGGTKKGKSYLNSHPAIMATFQSHFLYGNSK